MWLYIENTVFLKRDVHLTYINPKELNLLRYGVNFLVFKKIMSENIMFKITCKGLMCFIQTCRHVHIHEFLIQFCIIDHTYRRI